MSAIDVTQGLGKTPKKIFHVFCVFSDTFKIIFKDWEIKDQQTVKDWKKYTDHMWI